MLNGIHVKYHNPNYNHLTRDYHDNNTDSAQSFANQLLQNQKQNRDSSGDVRGLVEMTKDNIRASFDNSASHAFGKISLDDWYENQLALEQVHSERYQRGKAYIMGADDDDTMSLLYGFGINVYGTQWDSKQFLPVIDEELRQRVFTMGGNISEEQLQESMESLAKLIDKVLKNEYEKEPDSSLTNALLILRAELDFLPEKWEIRQKQATESLQSISLDSSTEEINEQLQKIGFGLSHILLLDMIDATKKRQR